MSIKLKIFFYLLLAGYISAMAENDFLLLKEKNDAIVTSGEDIAIRKGGFIHGFGKNADLDIYSPKSATFSLDGKKIYINSLEGCKTVVYDAETRDKLKVIEHTFDSGEGDLWLPASGYYPFTHYTDGEKKPFSGKPVEAALSKNGRYLFVPYYRRTFDINAQDPSALAVIDTRNDEIVLLVETGPLPKMVRVSNNGNLLAITHWGNNTVGFLDISDADPKNWKHLEPVTIGRKLDLNYSLTSPVNRDSGSGYLLRGTVFLPGDSILMVSGMSGPMAFIDTKNMEWIGMSSDLGYVRHITLNGDNLFMSRNSAGEVHTVPVANVVDAVNTQRVNSRNFKIDGIRKAKVGGGARTLKVSPEGKFIFVACNSASEIAIVRTRDMKLVGEIEADAYPVGLDISPDGTLLVSTSQGRNGVGGNAVDFFEVAYAEPEEWIKTPDIEELLEEPAVSEDSVSENEIPQEVTLPETENISIYWILFTILAVLLLFVFVLCFKKKKKL